MILATNNGGESWQRQFPPGGIEETYLDVHFIDSQRGFAVGAYGFARMTLNGGKDWIPHHVYDDEMHFNRLSMGPDGRLFLAVEGGDLLTSGNEGENWESMSSPYEGSLFGILPLGPRTLLTYGLRGHIFRSVDKGLNWSTVETDAHVLIMHGIRLSGGGIILAGQNGQFLASQDGGRTFAIWQVAVQGVAAVVECPDGAILAVGLSGAHRLTPPQIQSLFEKP